MIMFNLILKLPLHLNRKQHSDSGFILRFKKKKKNILGMFLLWVSFQSIITDWQLKLYSRLLFNISFH